jgi:hypothetical protein
VYDYDHNAPDVEYLLNTHKKMFDKIREKNPDLPIIMLTRPNRSLPTVPKGDRDVEIKARIDVVYNTYKQAIEAGDKNVYFKGKKQFAFYGANHSTHYSNRKGRY